MIDAAGQGAGPIQLAAAEMGRSLAAARAERPPAIALDVIGMHLAGGERQTTPEVLQLVAVIDAVAHLQPLLTAEPTPVQMLGDAIIQLQTLPPGATTAKAIVHLEDLVVLLTQSPVSAPPADVAKAIARVIELLTQLASPPA